MLKCYLASPFFCEEELNNVKKIEKALGNAGINYFSPRSEGVLVNMTDEERRAKFEDIYNSNIKNMNNCTIMIANIDDYDPGTIYELGFMSKSSKPIFSFSGKDYGLNVMLRQSVMCHNTKIENLITNIQEFISGKELTVFDELTNKVT